jgi:hypothetical protein
MSEQGCWVLRRKTASSGEQALLRAASWPFATPTRRVVHNLSTHDDVSRPRSQRSSSKAETATIIVAQSVRRTCAHQTAFRQVSAPHIPYKQSSATRATKSQRTRPACLYHKRGRSDWSAVIQSSVSEVAGTSWIRNVGCLHPAHTNYRHTSSFQTLIYVSCPQATMHRQVELCRFSCPPNRIHSSLCSPFSLVSSNDGL